MQTIRRFFAAVCLFFNSPQRGSGGRNAELFASSQSFALVCSPAVIRERRSKTKLKGEKSLLSGANDGRRTANVRRREINKEKGGIKAARSVSGLMVALIWKPV